ncbi:MAG: sugar phosphate nucleotidyltransferase [Thaumarchaeota archaeon]|nr:sugar phosphate nucleotidyltransferase [Nitrososphaerota archaeon]
MKAVLLVGGAGTRMRPLTYVVPKCLLPVGGKPLLERTIRYLGTYGVTEFVLCVAYLKKQIIDTFADGSSLGVKIEYAQAETPLGTAGQLRTASPFLNDTFLAMNGDIITNLNIGNLVDTHRKRGAAATIALKEFGVKIPYGHVVLNADGQVKAFEEKPTLNYMANAGVYVLEPRVIDSIPAGVVCSLETETFPKLISKGEKVGSYYEEAYWADVGSIADFERVNNEALEDPSIIVPQRPERID